MPDISGFVKKTDYNTKISEIENKVSDHNHNKNITTPEFNNLTTRVFTARLAPADLVTMTYFDTKFQDLSKIFSSKHLLVENELKKIKNI